MERKINIALIFSLLFFACNRQNETNQIENTNPKYYNDEIIDYDSINEDKTNSIIVETFEIDSTYIGPQFPGGDDSLASFIKRELVMPEQVKLFGINNTVCVKIKVSKKGIIYKKEIIMEIPLCSQCQEEAIRVIDKMPNWEPEYERNKDGSIKEITDGSSVICFDFK